MGKFMENLFSDTTAVTGVSMPNDENNHIINESIIFDMLGKDTKKLSAFFEAVGKFGARDNILNEDASIDNATNSFDNCDCADSASVLACAKEAGSIDYDLYIKSIMLMQECMKRMRSTFGDVAKSRLEAQKAQVESNPRVMDAVESCANSDK